jgi:hypothetical protein
VRIDKKRMHIAITTYKYDKSRRMFSSNLLLVLFSKGNLQGCKLQPVTHPPIHLPLERMAVTLEPRPLSPAEAADREAFELRPRAHV